MAEGGTEAVITGIGLITGLGADRESTWESLRAGDSAVRWLDMAELMQNIGADSVPRESNPWAGAPAAWVPPALEDDPFHKEPNIRLALIAAREAVADAGVDWRVVPPHRRGCVIGTSKGGMQSIARALAAERFGRAENGSSKLWPMFWPNTPASLIAKTWNIAGAVLCPVAACATGLMSLWRGAELIRQGTCDVVLAGSTDASLQPAVLGAFSRMGVLAREFTDPGSACRPFDRTRNGFVVGEGAAVMVLERQELAVARGVKSYAKWLGGGCVSDPTGMAHLDTEGAALSWLIADVLKRSDTQGEELDYINLHGTGTWDNDRTETRAIRRALGSAAEGVSCSSLKGALGHLLGAAGSVETACTLLAMRDNCIPPTRNLIYPDPACDLDYTPQTAQTRLIRKSLKLSLGFGGHQVAAILGRPDGD